MKLLKKGCKYGLYVLLIPLVSYLLIALILTYVTVNKTNTGKEVSNNIVFLNTNGVHLDVILPIDSMSEDLLKDLDVNQTLYMSFGWGEENFYLNTPTWGDLTFKNAFKALFLKSSTLLHLTNYKTKQADWVEININDEQLKKLNTYFLNTFEYNVKGSKIRLEDKGYSTNDNFYEAKGNYTCFNTCNTWVNSAFKTSGLMSCYWTPFDFGLINKYKK